MILGINFQEIAFTEEVCERLQNKKISAGISEWSLKDIVKEMDNWEKLWKVLLRNSWKNFCCISLRNFRSKLWRILQGNLGEISKDFFLRNLWNNPWKIMDENLWWNFLGNSQNNFWKNPRTNFRRNSWKIYCRNIWGKFQNNPFKVFVIAHLNKMSGEP